MPHTGEFGSFKLDFVTPLHFGGTTSPMSSYIQDFTPQQFFSGAPPSWIQDDSIDADELQQDLDECRRKLKACEAENERLRELLHKTKRFTQDQLGGVIKRRGPKVKKASRNREIAMARADAVLDIAKLFQGDELAKNVEHIVKAAILRDPEVEEKIIAAGIPLWREVEVLDNRYKCGYRKERDAALIDRTNAFILQASTGHTQKLSKQLRELGGRRIIDSVQTLQKWAVQQPELPEIRFVDPHWSSAVCVDIEDLLRNKILKNDLITQYMRTSFPYNKKVYFVWYMVSIASFIVMLTC